MKALALVMTLCSIPALAENIFLSPGECVQIGVDTVCARDNGKPMRIVNKVRVPKHSACSCVFGIRPVQHASDPQKGWWLTLKKIDGTTLDIVNTGTDEQDCLEATREHQLCRGN